MNLRRRSALAALERTLFVPAVRRLGSIAPAAATPITGASADVLEEDAFMPIVTVPVTQTGIATVAALEEPGGPLSSSFVRAVARLDGFIATAAQISARSRDHEQWSAHAQFRDEFVNTSSEPQTYVFDFDIFRMSLRILDLEGLPHYAEIFAQVGVNTPGDRKALFRIDEILEGSLFSHTLRDEGGSCPPPHSHATAFPAPVLISSTISTRPTARSCWARSHLAKALSFNTILTQRCAPIR